MLAGGCCLEEKGHCPPRDGVQTDDADLELGLSTKISCLKQTQLDVEYNVPEGHSAAPLGSTQRTYSAQASPH